MWIRNYEIIDARRDQELRHDAWILSDAWIRPDGRSARTRKVSLGWLLRHWNEVKALCVRRINQSDCGCSVLLIADIGQARTFETHFADPSMLRSWLDRPTMLGLPIWWFGVRSVVNRDNGFKREV